MTSSNQPARRSLGESGHSADCHDVIRVQGARENNLKDIRVELPKRRLTVFTNVSGLGTSAERSGLAGFFVGPPNLDVVRNVSVLRLI